jgi:hypothetical protein
MAFLSLAILIAAAQVSGPLSTAQSDDEVAAVEYGVKAAYLYQFGHFVQWPATEESTFSICVVKPDPFGEVLDRAVAGKAIGSRQVRVRRLAAGDDARLCSILFVPQAAVARTGEIVSQLRHAPVLTVGDSGEFVERGGAIGFLVQEGRVRFTANAGAAEASGLKMSAKLLNLARPSGRREAH